MIWELTRSGDVRVIFVEAIEVEVGETVNASVKAIVQTIVVERLLTIDRHAERQSTRAGVRYTKEEYEGARVDDLDASAQVVVIFPV